MLFLYSIHSAHWRSSHTQDGHSRPFVRLRKKQQPDTYQERPRAEAQAPSTRRSIRSGRDPRSIALTGAAHTPRTAMAVLLFDSGRNSSQARTRSAHELTRATGTRLLSPIRTRSAQHSAHRCSSHTQDGHGRPFVRLRKKQQPGTYQERPRAEAQAPSARCSLRSGQIRREKKRPP